MPRTLVLVPTDLERRVFAPGLSRVLGQAGVAAPRIELCGFGPVAAAARTAALIAEHTPDRVLLVGIAGRLDDRVEIGAVCRFAEVACHGVGAGSASDFQPAGALGWPQWPGDPDRSQPAIGDVIALAPVAGVAASATTNAQLLLTVCAASANAGDVALRRAAVPTEVAHDMEGFGVAFACRLAGVPVEIVRGISNTAGDRDTPRWAIEPALAAAADLAATILASGSQGARL